MSTMRGQVPDRMLPLLRSKISDANLSVHIRNAIYADGRFRTIQDLASATRDTLYGVHCIGNKSLTELEHYLRSHGLEFGMIFEERGGSLYVVDPIQLPSSSLGSPKPRLKDLIGRIVRVEISLPQGTGSRPEEFRVLNIEDSMICLEYEYTKEEKRTLWTGIKDLTFLVVLDTPEP